MRALPLGRCVQFWVCVPRRPLRRSLETVCPGRRWRGAELNAEPGAEPAFETVCPQTLIFGRPKATHPELHTPAQWQRTRERVAACTQGVHLVPVRVSFLSCLGTVSYQIRTCILMYPECILSVS